MGIVSFATNENIDSRVAPDGQSGDLRTFQAKPAFASSRKKGPPSALFANLPSDPAGCQVRGPPLRLGNIRCFSTRAGT